LLDEDPRILQQVDLLPQPIVISEHRGLACWCEHCQKTYIAPIHDDVRQAGLVGPRLTALVAYLKGACHCSFSTIRILKKKTPEKAIAQRGAKTDRARQELGQLEVKHQEFS
jgi:hypothetical protein